MESTKKRRWWQFGLKAMLYVMVVIAAYAAGYARRSGKVRTLEHELATVNDKYTILQRQVDWYDERFGYPVPSMVVLPSGEEAGRMLHPAKPKETAE